MIADLGNLLLYLALISSLLMLCMPYLKISQSWLKNTSTLVFLLCVSSLGCLIYCYVVSDFTILNVVNNSHTDKPLIYKISGAWGNHEGSMLLWIIAMSFFNCCFLNFSNKLKNITTYTVIVQSALLMFFIGFVIFTSNPFERVFPAPINGNGLNPILQDIGLAMHPPMLYLGYVGFSICYSSAIAALLFKQTIDKEWARLIRPWAMLSWSFLSLGIMLGSWWAYRELGWGGYWFWDPVENSSLLPWLTATALLHSLMVLEKTGNMKHWCVMLSITTFTLSMVGTFIVRSGLITSVHSFALDPERGVFILSFLVITTSIALLLYALRSYNLKAGNEYNLVSKVVAISLGNILLVTAAFTVLLGTLYPLVLEIFTGKQVSVGPPYFNALFTPLILGLAFICALSFKMKWLKYSKFDINVIVAIILTLILCYELQINKIAEIGGIFISLWLMFETMYVIKKSSLSMTLAHLGIAIAIFAISINTAKKVELEKPIKLGQTIQFNGYNIRFNNLFIKKQDNYISRVADFSLQKGKSLIKLLPETRVFPVSKQRTTETAIYHNLFYDIYMAVGEVDPKGIVMARVYYEPMMSWLWLSGFLMFMGGIYSFVVQMRQKLLNAK